MSHYTNLAIIFSTANLIESKNLSNAKISYQTQMNRSDERLLNDLDNFFDEIQGIDKSDIYNIPIPDFTKVESGLSKPQRDIFKSNNQVNLFNAGQGSGKTHLGGVLSANFITRFPDARGMICANTYQQITQSTLFRVREVWRDEFGWKEYNSSTKEGLYVVGIKPPKVFDTSNHNYDTYRNIISFRSGATIYYGSLDNYKALDGKEVAWCILDETKNTREEAVKEVILGRLRQKGVKNSEGKDFNPLYLLTSPAKTQWLTEWFKLDDYEAEINVLIFSDTTYFCKDIGNKRAVIASTFHNEKNLPESYIINQLENLSENLQNMLVFGSPFSKAGGEVYKDFDRSKHCNPSIQKEPGNLHIAFDFNVAPYITLVIIQIHNKEVKQINEICLENPRNNTESLCEEFMEQYPPGSFDSLFVYGDPSGGKKDTRTKEQRTDYKIIRNLLKKYKPHLRVDRAAPRVAARLKFINAIFKRNVFRISIEVNPKTCPKTVADFSFMKEAADGTKLKQKVTENGVTFEKYGHCSDAFEYLMCSAFKREFLLHNQGFQNNETYRKEREVEKTWVIGKYTKSNNR